MTDQPSTITDPEGPLADRDGIEWIAHRGESFDAPENTLAAFRLAWDRGVPAVELDVHRSKDGVLVVCHDADTLRTTGEPLVIADRTFAEVGRLDAGRWKGQRWGGERLPRLGEVLAASPPGSRCFVELKGGPESIPALAEEMGGSGRGPESLVIIAFQAATIAEAKRKLPEVEAHLLADFRLDDPGNWRPTLAELIDRAQAIGADGLGLSAVGPIDRTLVHGVKSAGLRLHVWTVDDEDQARRLIEAGVVAITSNRAAWLRARIQDSTGKSSRSPHSFHEPS